MTLEGDWLVPWPDGRLAYGVWDASWPGAACGTCGGTIMRYGRAGAFLGRLCARCGTRVLPDVAVATVDGRPDVLALIPAVTCAR